MSFGPQRPGAALEDIAPPSEAAGTPAAPREPVDGFERNLCVTCVHASTCAIVAAIRSLGADGQVVISKCAAFFEVPAGPPAP